MYNDNHQACKGGCGELADECACARKNPLGSMTVTATFDKPARYRVDTVTATYIDTFSRRHILDTARRALGSATPTVALYRDPWAAGLRLRIADATPAQIAAVEAAFAQPHVPFTLTEV